MNIDIVLMDKKLHDKLVQFHKSIKENMKIDLNLNSPNNKIKEELNNKLKTVYKVNSLLCLIESIISKKLKNELLYIKTNKIAKFAYCFQQTIKFFLTHVFLSFALFLFAKHQD